MSLATSAPPTFRTVADLLESLGDIPAHRVLLTPPPGTATEEDVTRLDDHHDRLCELIDGVLVEKAMGLRESILAMIIGSTLVDFAKRHNLGIVAGEVGTLRFAPSLVLIPDVSFISWDRLPGRKIPSEPIPDLIPDLAVEVLSKSNTRGEMERKLLEYFRSGVRLVWFVEPKDQTVRVYTAVDQCLRLTVDESLDGGDVLPGFVLPLRQLFDQADNPAV